MTMSSNVTTAIGVGFGTAGLGGSCAQTVSMALDAGFRKFDTAEAEYWYDQSAVGSALRSFFVSELEDGGGKDRAAASGAGRKKGEEEEEEDGSSCSFTCQDEDLQISTKIPPWELTSVENIRRRAAASRNELVGFCSDILIEDNEGNVIETRPYPLDVYYIHAPECWKGWHPRCDNVGETLSLRDAWLAMEAVVGIDHSARRIGLSNVWPSQLLDIINFVKDRQQAGDKNGNANQNYPPPRIPDVLQAYADPLEPARELRQICEDHGIEFVSYSTLGTQHVMKNRGRRNPVLDNPSITMLAAKHERSVAEVVLSWALQRNMSVIPRSSKEHHIRELANLLTSPPFLDVNDLELVDGLGLN